MGRHQLNDCLNAKGERLVFVLNSLLNDCGHPIETRYSPSFTTMQYPRQH